MSDSNREGMLISEYIHVDGATFGRVDVVCQIIHKSQPPLIFGRDIMHTSWYDSNLYPTSSLLVWSFLLSSFWVFRIVIFGCSNGKLPSYTYTIFQY